MKPWQVAAAARGIVAFSGLLKLLLVWLGM